MSVPANTLGSRRSQSERRPGSLRRERRLRKRKLQRKRAKEDRKYPHILHVTGAGSVKANGLYHRQPAKVKDMYWYQRQDGWCIVWGKRATGQFHRAKPLTTEGWILCDKFPDTMKSHDVIYAQDEKEGLFGVEWPSSVGTEGKSPSPIVCKFDNYQNGGSRLKRKKHHVIVLDSDDEHYGMEEEEKTNIKFTYSYSMFKCLLRYDFPLLEPDKVPDGDFGKYAGRLPQNIVLLISEFSAIRFQEPGEALKNKVMYKHGGQKLRVRKHKVFQGTVRLDTFISGNAAATFTVQCELSQPLTPPEWWYRSIGLIGLSHAKLWSWKHTMYHYQTEDTAAEGSQEFCYSKENPIIPQNKRGKYCNMHHWTTVRDTFKQAAPSGHSPLVPGTIKQEAFRHLPAPVVLDIRSGMVPQGLSTRWERVEFIKGSGAYNVVPNMALRHGDYVTFIVDRAQAIPGQPPKVDVSVRHNGDFVGIMPGSLQTPWCLIMDLARGVDYTLCHQDIADTVDDLQLPSFWSHPRTGETKIMW